MQSENHLKTWNIYQSAWSPMPPAERRALLVQSVDADICYTDPGSAVRGLDALLAKIQESQTKFPGAYFKNDTFLEHHDSGLFHWTMYDAQGTPKVKGSSYGAFGADGKLRQASGFFKAA